jgi:hypothetical protein
MSPTSRPAERNVRFALVRLSPLTAGTLASDGNADTEGDRDGDGVSLGLAAGMVEDVEAGSTGIRAAIASRRTVPAVTIVFTTIDVPWRRHRPTSPRGRQSRSPGMMANQVCHHGLGSCVDAEDSRDSELAALEDAGRERPDQLPPSQ